MTQSVVVGFAGMTHLGLVSASAVAQKGFQTFCYDPDVALCGRLNDGDFPVHEIGLAALIASNSVRQKFVSDISVLATCDLIYISADVPTDDQSHSDLSGISALIQSVIEAMSSTALLVVLCQVPPGFTRTICGVSAERLYYQVETLVFGRAVERATLPERYIVGCAHPEQAIDGRFLKVLSAFNCAILTMRYESAELAKIAINCCLVASVSVANTLAELSEVIGADWNEIVPALRLDERIGPKCYLSPGLGIAGGNLERDLATVVRLSEQHGTDAKVIRSFMTNSVHRMGWAARLVRSLLPQLGVSPKIAIWGLAYKENTYSIKNSPSLETIGQLRDVAIIVHDPLVPVELVQHPNLQAVDEPLLALEDADILLILTPWPQYRQIVPAEIMARLKGRIVLDPYRVLDSKCALAAGLDYRTLGVAAHDHTASSLRSKDQRCH